MAAIAVLAICSMFLIPNNARANDYLEKEKHYNAYANGADRIHFVIPVWAYGASYDYYAYGDSYVSYTPDGGSETKIAWYKTDKYDENENKNSSKGTAYLWPIANQGVIIVTSMANGVNYRVKNVGNWSEKLYVTQKSHDGCSQVTFLEFDWYPPETLDKKNFTVKIESKFRRSYTDGNAMTCTCSDFGTFTYNTNIMTPQLYTPYIYQVNEGGPTGYGYAAVPYMIFNDPVSYTTSLDATPISISERGGSIYVMTTDTVQEQFKATFTMEYGTGDSKMTTTKTSVGVDIPPYHRIYDFTCAEQKDSTGTYTGNTVLQWSVKNPGLKDLVDGDYFELQRALEPDFSDAQTIDVIQMIRNAKNTDYTYIDDSRDTWTGNAAIKGDTIGSVSSYKTGKYNLYDEDGNLLFLTDVTISTDKMTLPSVPVYYRIRRASSSVWGWEHDFAKIAGLARHNFLAPLAETQENYTLNSDFANNRKVNFRFKLENREVEVKIPEKEAFQLSYSNVRTNDMVVLYIDYYNNETNTKLTITDPQGNTVVDVSNEGIYNKKHYVVPKGSVVRMTTDYYSIYNYSFTINSDTRIYFEYDYAYSTKYPYYQDGKTYYYYITDVKSALYDGSGYTPDGSDVEPFVFGKVKEQLLDSMYNLFKANYEQDDYGRCMWDRTAQLVLTRTIEETGQSMDIIIPQDSIRREADGSWTATYTDVADKACSHYKYSVRIDQSKSDLHVQDSVSLRPIKLTGPDLYFDEGASINNMTASQGDATTQMKNGVLIRWEANNNNFDRFVLLRKEMNSTASADTLIVTSESNYFDRSAVPDMHYEYTVEAHYACNGRTTVNAATAEGWRTPYGEISGTILMPDNTGMAGVTVALQDANGNILRTMTTDASGAYKFDSLNYEAVECDDPKVEIKYSHTLYSNDPEPYTLIRVLDAAGKLLRDWSSMRGIYTYPAGTVFEVKTTESGNIREGDIFSFTLQGNSVLNCYNGTSYLHMFQRTGNFQPQMEKTSDVDCHSVGNASTYSVVPAHQYGTFSFNNTSAGTASITLSPYEAVASGIDFVNTSTTRLSGRVLYKMSTIPVAGAMFLLNGDTVRRGNTPLTSGINGNFELVLPLRQPCRLQVFKPGHTFEGDGILHVTSDDADETDDALFTLTKPLDGVRFYDMTKVRLVGRVAGGNDQRDLPHGFGLGRNNLGDDLQLVLQLEGDNTAQLVHDPDDLTLDTIRQTTPHVVYQPNMADTVGTTHTLFEKKRITIQPDPETGEFAVDLFPVKYKVIQATAKGYATLFASGQGSETFDLTQAPMTMITDTIDGKTVQYNALYDRIYHTPMQVSLSQMIYGLERDGLGEPSIEVSNIDPSQTGSVNLYEKQDNGEVNYLLGYPLFIGGRKYQFVASAYEDYHYNNDRQAGTLDRVPLRGGSVTIHNGMHNATNAETYILNEQGRNSTIWLMVDEVDVNNIGENALRPVSIALEQEGNIVEAEVFRGFVIGTVIQQRDLRMTDARVVLLDIVRDPGGAGSSAWVEQGSTYNYSYKDSYDWEVGLYAELKYGLNVSSDIGVVTAPTGVGSYTGSNFTTSKQLTIPIPVSHKFSWAHQYDYTITTTERIATSTSATSKGVGGMADVFFGTTISQIAGKAKTISVISDSLYRVRKPAFDAGAMRLIAQGTGADGENYYLVTGQKVVLGSTLNNSFAYSQHYILNTLLPEIGMERQNLLMQFGSREEAQAAADSRGEEVYWYHPEGEVTLRDTLPKSYYEMIYPNDDNVYTDRVAALNNIIADWVTILYQNENEKEKVAAMGTTGQKVGTYSVSYGATVSHSDQYTASSNYNEVPQGADLFGYDVAKGAVSGGSSLAQTLATNLKDFFGTANSNGTFGKSAADALKNFQTDELNADGTDLEQKSPQELGTVTNTSKFSMSLKPLMNFNTDRRTTDVKTIRKSAGFNIVSDTDGDITVSVYRVPYKTWADTSAIVRDQLDNLPDNDDMLYGSYVFYTDAGATFCPPENEERTLLYNKGTLIGNGTQKIVKPEMTANTYEITNVQPQNKATFLVQLMNNSEVDTGVANDGHALTLMLDGESNPYGAVVTVDGMPLTQGISYWIVPGRPLIKTVEVARGSVDDYNNLSLLLYASDCMKTITRMNLSVHFLPVSSDVSIASPRQNWIMNTLSAQDSVGYYIPIDINGFDINHKNFDHIEFQYKLSTQSEDDWVNQCSFYASDSLYRLATGNKAMIENGRIVPFRFYGERDPMEQRYDLRAVSFCRYGSGFVTKSSLVISGTKDTRPPRVFSEPEPVNAILGVGDNLKLRFNEPIAGNYLDEDNNFQLVGYTNETGITTKASVHFDGTPNSYAATQVSRSLEARSYSIDMVVKPTNPDAEAVFFEHGFDRTGVVFGKTADNRLYLQFGTYMIFSKPLPDKMLDFTRVVLSYNYPNNTLRFYAGTEDVTDPDAKLVPDIPYTLNAPLVFGRGMDGNMLEVRLWTKPLTQEDVTATNMRYLTGFEQELVAYYPMNEAAGNTVSDKATGATLTLNGASWNLPKGISLALKNGEKVTLAKNVLSRSAVYDATYMLWFRNTSTAGTIFSAGDKRFALADSQLQWLLNDSTSYSLGSVGTDEWHHLVLTINHTYNNVALYVDGKMKASYPATLMTGMTGDMFFGGDGFEGNIDEFVVFEQALPKTLIQDYGNRTPAGDEMGLMAYLPFEEQKQNANGVLELVFSVNDQRQFRDANGNVVNKVVPLLLESNQPILADHADKAIFAPVTGFGLLTKLNFDWAFNQDELLINLKMADREINKQTLYITVRDVEDLNGNPMPSPVMWTAYVDRNALKWDYRQVEFSHEYNNTYYDINHLDISFTNQSGRRHQYSIESLPAWLTVDETSGSVDPTEFKQVRFSFDFSMPVGTYTDLVYLTDENGLSEPLRVNYEVQAKCPWNEPSATDYPLNMSVCGQVQLDGEILTNPNDKVIALCRNECVGMANIDFDNITNRSRVFLTVYGNEQMNKKAIRFQLWQASTGKVLTLTPSVDIAFAHGAVYGCGNEEPVIFTAGGGEEQNITLQPGWNWTSFNIGVYANQTGIINDIMTASQPWTEGDLIKNPTTRNFCVYSDSLGQFTGSLYHFRYVYSHMIYSEQGNTIRVSGNVLPQDSMHVTLRGNGQWSPLPCLFSEATPVAEALADYFDNATVGDMVKAHNRFAYFSDNKRWEGNLTALQPGEGYFFHRLGQGDVTIHFYNRPSGSSAAPAQTPAFHGKAETNMTLITQIKDLQGHNRTDLTLHAYVGEELAGIAVRIDSLYFLTVSSNLTDNIRFATSEGEVLTAEQPVRYQADLHIGTPTAPLILHKEKQNDRFYKIIENGHVIIIRNGERYDITGKQLNR